MKILVIRLSSMGDIIMTTPVIRWLSTQLESEIHFITKKEYHEVIEHNPYITSLRFFDQNLSLLIEELKTENFDIVIDLHNNIRSRKISRSLGKRTLTYPKETIAKWLYLTTRINRLSKKHIIDKHLELLSPLGIVDDGNGMDFFADPKGNTKTQLRPYTSIVIVLGGKYATKRIPPELIASLPTDILERCVQIGGRDVEQSNLKGIPAINLVGKTSLQESASIIGQAELVITGDTGMMHLACALQKPTVVVWGSTGPDWGFRPYYGKNSSISSISIIQNLACQPCSKYGRNKCPKNHMNCLKTITSAQLVSAITALRARD